MEKFSLDLRRASAPAIGGDDGGEDDGFYEEIEAPQFVDLTMPDGSRPDDASWFCARVGCDQTHKMVDPEALHRSFVLRVMAARSPNVRFRKALSKQSSSSIMKWPNSAPPKPAKERLMRLSRMTSIPEKTEISKVKGHQISNLRLTPKTNKRSQPPTIEKSLTTPKIRRTVSVQEAFRSVKHQKVHVSAPKRTSVAKALFLQTPKKDGKAEGKKVMASTPISQVCAEMRTLKIGSALKHAPKSHLCKASRCAACDPIRSEASSCQPEGSNTQRRGKQRGVTCDAEKETESSNEQAKPEETNDRVAKETTSINSSSDTSDNSKGDIFDCDENKENAPDKHSTSYLNSSATQSESEPSQIENYDKLPHKGKGAPMKAFQERHGHKEKLKKIKPTNPKPFRLRTDERGILKEANLGKRPQFEAQRKAAAACRRGDDMQHFGPCRKEVKLDCDKEVQKDQTLRTRTACMKLATNNRQKHDNVEFYKEKAIGKPQKVVYMASSSQLAKSRSAIELKEVPVSKKRQEKRTQATISGSKATERLEPKTDNRDMKTPTSSGGKKPATILKQPKFHKIIPKGCTKRSDITN